MTTSESRCGILLCGLPEGVAREYNAKINRSVDSIKRCRHVLADDCFQIDIGRAKGYTFYRVTPDAGDWREAHPDDTRPLFWKDIGREAGYP